MLEFDFTHIIHPALLYQISWITFVCSVLFIFLVWPILRWIEWNKMARQEGSYYPNSRNHRNNNHVGLTVVQAEEFNDTEAETMTQKPSHDHHEKMKPIINLINEIEGRNGNGTDVLNRFWKENHHFLKCELNIRKSLFLKLESDSEFTIIGYDSFGFDSLQGTEDELHRKSSPLKELIFQSKNLYFSGELCKSKLFKSFFTDSEQDQFNQIYLLPVKKDNELAAVLILINSSNDAKLEPGQLKELVEKLQLILS